MEFEIEEPLETGLWDFDRREKSRIRQIDRHDMSRKAFEIPESEEL